MIWSRVSAQEQIDEPVIDVIVTEPAPELDQPVVTEPPLTDTPPQTGGVVVQPDWYDDTRLQIMSAQSLSFETTGEYTQISKQAEIIDGDSITFEAVKADIFTGKEEVHVYDAPCGRGWQLIIYDEAYGYFTSSTTGKTEYLPYPVIRSYGYGCEHTSRTVNW